MTVQASGYASNPFTTVSSKEKIDTMKAEQEKKRAELKGTLNEYREAYEAEKKEYNRISSIFLMQRAEFNKYDKTDADYKTQEKEFNAVKKQYFSQRSKKDLQLSLLQFHSDNYVKASRINVLELV